MKYLDTKGDSLEDSVTSVLMKETNKNNRSDDGEGLDAVQPKAVKKKFKDRKDKDIDNDGDVDSSDKYLHKRRKAISKNMKETILDMWKESVNEKLDEGGMKQVKSLIDDIVAEMGKDKQLKPFADKFRKDAEKSLDPRKSLEKVLPDYVAGKEISRLLNMGDESIKEVFDIGNDWAKHTLKVTPGQSEDAVDEMLGIAQEKNISMRKTLANIWGMDEGKNPFEKSEEKIKEKTLTGKKPTEVNVDPEIDTK
jgi:hypothetical protein